MNEETKGSAAKSDLNSQTTPGDFLVREYTPIQQFQINIFRALIFTLSVVLRLGRRPLRSILINIFGFLTWLVMPTMRRNMRINLDIAFGDEKTDAEKKKIVRGCFRHFIRLGLDSLFMEVYFPHKKLAKTPIENFKYFGQALEGGRGFCGITGHLGNWEIGGATMIEQGIPMSVIFKRMSNPLADWLIGQKRINFGVDLLQSPEKKKKIVNGEEIEYRESLGPAIENILLNKNQSVNFLFDQYATGAKKSVDAPVFGTPAPTHTGFVKYALEFNSPCILGACVYVNNHECKIILQEPVYIESKGSSEETFKYWLTEFNQKWEEIIRLYPEQWAWGHRRYYRDNYKKSA